MSDKLALPEAPEALFALPDHHVVALTGRDAVPFAQAQTMNDVAGLADGRWQWNGWLTPKGRVVALFALLRLDAETVWLLLPDADPRELAATLQRFVFRSKVAISVRDDLHVAGRFATPAQASAAQLAGAADTALELDFSAEGGARTLRIAVAPQADDAGASVRWRAFDLAHGLPRLDASQHEHWTPQQLSLGRLRAFSVNKGCYPGQEIVARTHFLGQAKRGLALLRTDAAVSPGDAVRRADAGIGHVASAVHGNPGLALAVLPLGDLQEGLEIGGSPATAMPLAGGLAR